MRQLGGKARGVALALGVAICLSAPHAKADPMDDLAARAATLQQRLAEARAAQILAPLQEAHEELAIARMAMATAKLLHQLGEQRGRQAALLDEARSYLLLAREHMTPSRGAEARGIFLDASSIPEDPAGISRLLDLLAATHFNIILPEVFRRGYTMYPARYTEQDPEFVGKGDVLGELVAGAHLRGMLVVPWVWAFRVRSPGFGNPILSRFPALAARGPGTATDPRFLSPADPRARELVYDILGELVSRYDLDGLMLDYIRYDELTPVDWTSETEFRLEYLARHGAIPTDLSEHSPLWPEWQLWREHQVDTAVEDLSHQLRQGRPDFRIGVATFPNERYSRLHRLQNWRHWADNAWIDYDASMIYTPSVAILSHRIQAETDDFTRSNLLYPILGPLRMTDPVEQALDQIDLVRGLQQPGILFFSLGHMSPALFAALAEGPFREPAIVPDRNPILAAREVLSSTTERYLANSLRNADLQTAGSLVVVRDALRRVEHGMPLSDAPYYENQSLMVRLAGMQELVAELGNDGHLAVPVANQVENALGYAITLVRANQARLGATHYVPPSPPPSPFPPPAPELDETHRPCPARIAHR